jgi:hypothetical protein
MGGGRRGRVRRISRAESGMMGGVTKVACRLYAF